MKKKLFGLLLLLLAGAAFYLFYEQYEARLGALEPQELTVEQLVEQGYGDNAHVELRNFVPLEQPLIRADRPVNDEETEEQVDAGEETARPWRKCLVPLIPAAGDLYKDFRDAEREGRFEISREVDVRVLVRTTLRDEDSLEVFYRTPPETIRGVVIHEHEPLSEWERERLLEEYPATELEQVLVIEQGRAPLPNLPLALVMFGGGIFLVLLGLIVLIGGKKGKENKKKVKGKK